MANNLGKIPRTSEVYTKDEADGLLAGKVDKSAVFTEGNLAKFDSEGNPTDSGKSLEDIQDQIDTESPLLARSYAVPQQPGWTVNQGSSGSPIYFRPRYFGMRDGDLFKGIVLRTRSSGRTPFPSGVYMRLKRYSDGQTLGVSELTAWPDTASTDVVFRFPRAVELTSSGNYYTLDFSETPAGNAVNFGMSLYSLPSGSTNPDFYFASSTNVPIATAQFYSWEELTGADIAVSDTDATKISDALAGKANRVSPATDGDIAALDANGNLKLSGMNRDGNGNLDATEFTFTPTQVADYDSAAVGTVISKATTSVVLHDGQHYVVRKSFVKTNSGWNVDSVTGRVVLPGASGMGSTALGEATQATGNGAVSTGKNTKASGAGALSFGQETDAVGTGAHAEGQSTSATATCAHSEGYFTIAQNQSEHAQGEYNASHTGVTASEKTLNSIGIGDSNERKNAVEVMRDGKTFIYGLGDYDGTNPTSSVDLAASVNGKLDSMEAIAWSDLKAKRDGGNLVPGQQYRITDYVATTNGDMESQSASHPFDIIVTSDGERTLNERARAVIHEGDTYFAGCDLAAWDVWYCLDNDASRFAWADSTSGKGVIYRLVDEFQNDCPYDFKGLQFKAYGDTDDVWRYTFDSGDASGNTDLSKSGLANFVYKNTISPYSDSKWKLNCIVFKGPSCRSNTFGSDCSSNAFGSSCSFNTFGSDCSFNTFGSDCSFNAFGSDCSSNAFGSSCYSNAFGSYCSSNAFGSDCSSNAFGSYCRSNTFGSDCSTNAFGSYCRSNTFGSSCSSNAFGSDCSFNAFGSDCSSNAFGSYCRSNAFGSGCYVGDWGNYSQWYAGTVVKYSNVLRIVLKRYRGSFSTSQTYLAGETLYYQSKYWECTTQHRGAWNAAHFTEVQLVGGILSADKFVPLSYYRYVELEDGVSYVALDCTADRGGAVYYKNVTVSKGVGGTYSAPKHIEDANYSQSSKTIYQQASTAIVEV